MSQPIPVIESSPGSKSEADRNLEAPLGETTRGLAKWQNRTLPFMVGTITVLTAFFLIASLFQLYQFEGRVEKSPKLELEPTLRKLEMVQSAVTDETKMGYLRWETLTILEANVVQRRYHQANVLLLARIWTKYLGFMTGMILALVGAVFILGKLREEVSNIGAESSLWKLSITTASPGIVLAVLGTVLMFTTMVTQSNIEVKDSPTYIARDQLFLPEETGGAAQPLPKPGALSGTTNPDSSGKTDDELRDEGMKAVRQAQQKQSLK